MNRILQHIKFNACVMHAHRERLGIVADCYIIKEMSVKEETKEAILEAGRPWRFVSVPHY